MKNILIIGMGEIGSAIADIENEYHYIDINNKTAQTNLIYDICHVTIPYSDKFEDTIINYFNIYNIKNCIIHSTVEVGTCKRIQLKVSTPINYSFVRGLHPNLTKGIKTFEKYIYGTDYKSLLECFLHMKNKGIPVKMFEDNLSNGELAKLLDTTYYGYNIIFAKHAKKLCEDHGLDFYKVYTLPNETYNEGYKKLGIENVVRPVLYPPSDKIGGHCVVENFHLLPQCDLKEWSIKNA